VKLKDHSPDQDFLVEGILTDLDKLKKNLDGLNFEEQRFFDECLSKASFSSSMLLFPPPFPFPLQFNLL